MCARCGLSCAFGMEEDAELECGAYLADMPDYDRARAVFQYEDVSRSMILAFKHGDRIESAPAFAAWMARAGADLVADADLIVSVPLHRKRLVRRRYNQSAVLALYLARLTAKPAMVDGAGPYAAHVANGGIKPAGTAAQYGGDHCRARRQAGKRSPE